ncbi:MAG: zinc ribbon domain-containing protein [Solirubrobacterales bacterium]
MRLVDRIRRTPSPSQTTSQQQPVANGSAPAALNSAYGEEFIVDLERRREQLVAKVAELQWDLGGLVYEMIVRNSIDVEVIVKRAVPLQDADAELGEVERILRMEQSGTAGLCTSCGAPHSSGATFCWQCGKPLLTQVSGDEILKR